MTVKKIVFFLLFATIITSGKSQIFEWAKNMGGIEGDVGKSLVTDNTGCVYITGSFSDIADFNPGEGTYNLSSNGYSDIFICKLSSKGKFIWAKSIGGIYDESPASIALDDFNNLYITGTFQDTVDFDPGTNTNILVDASINYFDAFVAKLDSSGNFIWANRMGGVSEDNPESIIIDNSGNVCITGWFQDTADYDPGPGLYYLESSGFRDIFILKLDNSGNFLWAKSVGGIHNAEELSHSITHDEADNIYITGAFLDTVDFNPGPGECFLSPTGYCTNSYILKLTSFGDFVWAKRFEGTGSSDGLSILSDNSCNIYSIGIFGETIDIDLGAENYYLNSSVNADIYITKIDSSGNFIWGKNIGDSSIISSSSIAIDHSNNIYLTGKFYEIIDFDPDTGVFSLSVTGDYNAFILKLDSMGKFEWAKNIGGNSSANGAEITTDDFENVYVTGFFNDCVDFNPDSSSHFLFSTGSFDSFALKLRQHGVLGKVYLDSNQNCIYEEFEAAIQNHQVKIIPGEITTYTNDDGIWALNALTPGTYTAIVDTTDCLVPTCPYEIVFTIVNSNDLITTSDYGLDFCLTENNYLFECVSKDISVFPNPAITEINVKADVPVTMKLYDVYGRIVTECEGNYLNIRELKNGLYIIRVFDEKGSQIKVEKIVKESGF